MNSCKIPEYLRKLVVFGLAFDWRWVGMKCISGREERQKILLTLHCTPRQNANFFCLLQCRQLLCIPAISNFLQWQKCSPLDGLWSRQFISSGNVSSARETEFILFNFNCHVWLVAIILDNTGLAGALLPPPLEGPLKCYLLYETFPDPTAWKVGLFSLVYHSNLPDIEKLHEVMSACKLKINLIKLLYITL